MQVLTQPHPARAAPPPSPWTEATEGKLRDLWGKGMSLSGIAAAIGGINRNQVVGKVHRLGLEGRPSPLKPEARAWYRDARAKSVAFDARLYAERLAETGESSAVQDPVPVATSGTGTATNVETLFGTGPHLGARNAVGSLSNAQCRWPFGDPREEDFRFCRDRARPGAPYCGEHARMAYAPPQSRKPVAA